MTIFLQFGLDGLAFGAIYALLALGIIVIHRGSGVVNFGQGAVGMAGTYIYQQLHSGEGWHFWPAFLLCVALCAIAGLVIQFLVMHPMRRSSPLSRLLATLGISIALEAAISIEYPQSFVNVQGSLPTGFVHIFGAVITEDRLGIVIITIVLALILGAVYKFTRFGRATTAIAENPLAASTLGYSPNRLGAYNWALGSALAVVAGILVAPIVGLTETNLTLMVIPALAAAVIGGMNSFPITVIAAFVIGIAESETTQYIHTPGWSVAVPLIAVLGYLIIRGRGLPDRSQSSLRLPKVGSGALRPSFIVISLATALVVLFAVPNAWVVGTTTTMIFAIILLSITVITGYAGQLSLATFSMAGIGAYVAGRLSETQGWPFLLVVVIGVAFALPVGIVVGLPALRTRGANLAIATLALSVGIESVLFDSSPFTGGQLGTVVKSPEIFGISIDPTAHPRSYGVAVLVFLLIVALAVANLRRSRTGRQLLAVRANERAAAALGVGIVRSKLYAFCVGSMIAALGGILLAFQSPYIDYSTFTSLTSLNLVGDSVIGGLGFVGGSVPGAIFQPGTLSSNVIGIFSDSAQAWLSLAAGLLLIVMLISAPNGSASEATGLWRILERKVPLMRKIFAITTSRSTRGARVTEISSTAPRTASGTLRAEGLTVRFGNSTALNDVSIEVRPGEVVGLIGPNGAGKTTFIDAVTGFVKPSAGKVFLNDVDISHQSATHRANAGLARSFQSLELFEDMTVRENLLVASEESTPAQTVLDLIYPHAPNFHAATLATIEEFRLADALEILPTDLSYGRRRLVAIARAIAAAPSVLLLDEPAAGLDEQERLELSDLVRRLAHEWGIAVLLIEHDVDLVMRTCDRISVLNFGSVIAEGSPSEIRDNPKVIESYLGDSGAVEEIAEEGAPASVATSPGPSEGDLL